MKNNTAGLYLLGDNELGPSGFINYLLFIYSQASFKNLTQQSSAIKFLEN